MGCNGEKRDFLETACWEFKREREREAEEVAASLTRGGSGVTWRHKLVSVSGVLNVGNAV